jgi:ribonucleoside-diphosphate reductase alpha chain
MIKEMIKFDGTSEPFTAEKPTKWGKWAARKLGNRVDWASIVVDAVNECPPVLSTQEFQEKLIDVTLRGESWAHYLMAGKLYAPLIMKKTFGATVPTIRELHLKLAEMGYMYLLDYSEAEYAELEKIIAHKKDQTYPHFRSEYIYKKYALQNRMGAERNVFETPQFVYMRMAMALAEEQPRDRRMQDAVKFYEHLSDGRINAPTPNYVNLGTPLRGFASCCIYSNEDTAASIGIGLHIAYTMTYMSAGCGTHLNTRSLGDAVRGGMIKHQGKLPYIKATKAMVEANLQNGRGGADTLTWSMFDPENETLLQLQNPMSVEEKQIRGIDYSVTVSKFIARFAGKKGKLFKFNSFTAPDLYDAFYSADFPRFEALYDKYEQDPMFVKDYFNARELVLVALTEALETGRYYLTWADEMNRHTPFYDPIFASNLCQEIMLHQRGYAHMMDLYATDSVGFIKLTTEDNNRIQLAAPDKVYVNRCAPEGAAVGRQGRKVIAAIELQPGEEFRTVEDGLTYKVKSVDEIKHEPEVAMCNIGAVVPANIESDEQWAEVTYYTLLMIDICIHKAEYELPHIGYTTKARMNAGVGLMGVATWMAKNNLKFSTQEGKDALFHLDETHMYHLITQSIKLGQERGNAEWMHRTRWPEGYLPQDSANQNVLELITVAPKRDWAPVRQALIDNNGMRFSCVNSHMPGESSSKAAGQPNGRYPVRDVVMTKTDNGIVSRWAAPEGDLWGDRYECAWDIHFTHQIDSYAIGQYWTDQGMSADLWRRLPQGETVGSTELLEGFFRMTKYGLKSRYYYNTLTTEAKVLGNGEIVMIEVRNTDKLPEADCGSGGCKM